MDCVVVYENYLLNYHLLAPYMYLLEWVNMLIYVDSSVSLHCYLIWTYLIDMKLVGEVNVIR